MFLASKIVLRFPSFCLLPSLQNYSNKFFSRLLQNYAKSRRKISQYYSMWQHNFFQSANGNHFCRNKYKIFAVFIHFFLFFFHIYVPHHQSSRSEIFEPKATESPPIIHGNIYGKMPRTKKSFYHFFHFIVFHLN